jgi:hypothetical protein
MIATASLQDYLPRELSKALQSLLSGEFLRDGLLFTVLIPWSATVHCKGALPDLLQLARFLTNFVV